VNKWKEFATILNFLHTTSSVAYVLRKYYVGILNQNEKVYYFGTQGHLVLPGSISYDYFMEDTCKQYLGHCYRLAIESEKTMVNDMAKISMEFDGSCQFYELSYFHI
jgi:hypothetical protein